MPGSGRRAGRDEATSVAPTVPQHPTRSEDTEPSFDVAFVLDPDARWTADGRALLGGEPLRLFRFSERGAAAVRLLGDGHTLAETGRRTNADVGRLTRRLLDAGVLHPSPRTGPYVPADVTVVVPVRDRAAALGTLLSSLSLAGARVVVVDDGSLDGSADVAERAGAGVVRRPDSGGPAVARNAGWAHPRHEEATPLVAFLDSDCLPDPDWLGRLLPHFADPRVGAVAPRLTGGASTGAHARSGTRAASTGDSACDGVGGTPCPARDSAVRRDHTADPIPDLDARDTAVARYDAACSALDLGARPAAVRPGTRVSYVPAAALVVRREALAAIGGFDEDLPAGEDVDLVWRLVDAGWTVRYDPSVTVAHGSRTTFAAMAGRRFAYGTSAAPLARRHPGRLAPVRVPAWSLAAWAPLAARSIRLPVRAGASAAVLIAAGASLARRLDRPAEPIRRPSPPCPECQDRRNRLPVGRRPGQPFWPIRRSPVPAAAPRAGPNGSALGRRLVARLVVHAHLATLRSLRDGLFRPYAPLTLAALAAGCRRARPVVLAAAAARVGAGWWPRRRQIGPAAFAALRLGDDFAYSLGVWWGCAVHRTVAPLVPQVSVSPWART